MKRQEIGRRSNFIWNPWHGCVKYSEGCANCYVYRRDESVGRDASAVFRTASFDEPVRRGRGGEYKIPPGAHVFACMTSDFFLAEADEWRAEAWTMIFERSDVEFTIITKRVLRVAECLPDGWGGGRDNVRLLATMENQRRADERMGEFLALPFRRKGIICEPLLGEIDFRGSLGGGIESVTVGGESGSNARELRWEWVLSLREQCAAAGVAFGFKQTGANFVKDGRRYAIARRFQHSQARRAGIDLPRRER